MKILTKHGAVSKVLLSRFLRVIPDEAKLSHARSRCALRSIQESPHSARGDSCPPVGGQEWQTMRII